MRASLERRLAGVLGAALVAGLMAGPALAAGSLPTACDVLKGLEAPEALGKAPQFDLKSDQVATDMRVTMCVASGGPHKVTLLMRASAKPPKDSPEAQRDAYVEGLSKQLGLTVKPEPAKGGTAATWIAPLKQLTFWSANGQDMMTLAGIPKDAAEALAAKIAARP